MKQEQHNDTVRTALGDREYFRRRQLGRNFRENQLLTIEYADIMGIPMATDKIPRTEDTRVR